jgi:hypothetical protein
MFYWPALPDALSLQYIPASALWLPLAWYTEAIASVGFRNKDMHICLKSNTIIIDHELIASGTVHLSSWPQNLRGT